MAVEIRVPRLGWNMEEGVFVAWHKKDGEHVSAGDVLFVLEGDKAVQEVEATDAGILRIAPHGPDEGDTVAVGTVLGYLVAPGEQAPLEMGPVIAAAPAQPGAADVPRSAPPARRGRRRGNVPAISPRARRVAEELGIDWTRLKGSGRTGRIRERDVRAAARAAVPAAAEDRGLPVTPTRRAVAERMLHSLRSTAPVTLTTTADATNLVNLRGQFRAASAGEGPAPGYTDFLVKLVASALEEHPLLKGRWEGDRIVVPSGTHVGIAVDTEAGLLVPVIRDVPALGLRQVAARSRELAERARARKLTAGELSGGTFTVSNLGAFGVDAFTPIINHPESAILGVGRIRRQPAVVENQVVPCVLMVLSLTFDHRIVDGVPAGAFLRDVRRAIEAASLEG